MLFVLIIILHYRNYLICVNLKLPYAPEYKTLSIIPNHITSTTSTVPLLFSFLLCLYIMDV